MLLPAAQDLTKIQVDADLQSKAAAAAHAEIRNYITTLDAAIDLRSLRPGQYHVAVRHGGDYWQFYRICIE